MDNPYEHTRGPAVPAFTCGRGGHSALKVPPRIVNGLRILSMDDGSMFPQGHSRMAEGHAPHEEGALMEELLPAAALRGMDDPLTWLQDLATRLVVRPPCTPARWLNPTGCLAALQWYVRLGSELVTVFLMAHADRVEIGVWTTAWSDDQVGYWMYHELVITIATLLIDQYADQDGPVVRLRVQPYTETQAPLNTAEEGE
jgi:hypothetical protein